MEKGKAEDGGERVAGDQAGREVDGEQQQRGLHEMSPLQIKDVEPPDVSCWQRGQGLTAIILLFLIKSLAITITLIVFIYYGEPQLPAQGVVISDSTQCSELGKHMLMKDGSAVDAAVSTALCLGVVHPHRSGLGGGGVALLHDHKSQSSEVVDYLESAPADLTDSSLFAGGDGGTSQSVRYRSGIAVGVPGALRAMKHLHSRYGRMSWAAVVRAAAEVADGFHVTADLAKALADAPDMQSALFPHVPKHPILENAWVTLPKLGRTLHDVAENGVDGFYTGQVARRVMRKVQSNNGVMKLSDLSSYQVRQTDALSVMYDGYTVVSTPPPTSGPLTLAVLNILDAITRAPPPKPSQPNGTTSASAIPRPKTDAELYALALLAYRGMYHFHTQLGDPLFMANNGSEKILNEMISLTPEIVASQDFTLHDTDPVNDVNTAANLLSAQIITYDKFGQMVSLTSSLGSPFGSRLVTSDGIVLNNKMQDFSSADGQANRRPNPNNVVAGGKRPLSAMSPTVMYVQGKLCENRILLAAGSGVDAVLSTLQTVLHVSRSSLLSPSTDQSQWGPGPGSGSEHWDSEDMGNMHTAVTTPRLRLRITSPNVTTLDYEEKFPTTILDEVVRRVGEQSKREVGAGTVGVTHLAIKYNNTLTGYADHRIRDAGAVIAGVAHF